MAKSTLTDSKGNIYTGLLNYGSFYQIRGLLYIIEHYYYYLYNWCVWFETDFTVYLFLPFTSYPTTSSDPQKIKKCVEKY